MRALTSAEFYTVFDIWVEAATKNSKKDWWREEFLVAWEYLQANGWRSVVHSDSPQPVDSYCREFHAWANKKADDRVFWRHWCTIELTIHKSCLLDRLIYGGETLRTEKCPQHQGRWSGCRFEPCECSHGSCVTGWLPNENDPISQSNGVITVIINPATGTVREYEPGDS